MLRDVVEVKALPEHNLWIKFDDGVSGKADLKTFVRFRGVCAPLKDEAEFAKVYVHPEWGAVCWPGGQDLDTEVLYSLVTGQPITLADGTVVTMDSDHTHV